MATLRLAASAAVVACSAPPAGAPEATGSAVAVDGGERFDAACRFVPEAMLSYWFRDWRQVQFGSPPSAGGPAPVVTIIAARTFDPPHGPGVGSYEGVYIADYGAGKAVPAIFHRSLPPDGRVGGCPTWRGSEQDLMESAVKDLVWALVDDRFVVQVSRGLAEESLARKGDRRRLLQPFGPRIECWSRSGELPDLQVHATVKNLQRRRASGYVIAHYELEAPADSDRETRLRAEMALALGVAFGFRIAI